MILLLGMFIQNLCHKLGSKLVNFIKSNNEFIVASKELYYTKYLETAPIKCYTKLKIS